MLAGSIPYGHDKDEARVDYCLKETQQEPIRSYAGEIRASRGGDDDNAPNDRRQTDDFADGKPLDGIAGGEL